MHRTEHGHKSMGYSVWCDVSHCDEKDKYDVPLVKSTITVQSSRKTSLHPMNSCTLTMDVKVVPVPHPRPHPPAPDVAWASYSSPATSPTPTSATSKLCERYRTARLRALHEYPDAFSSTYEDEEKFEEQDWLKRLMNRDARTFAAVVSSGASTSTSICHGASGESSLEVESEMDVMKTLTENEWTGMIVLLGPRVLAADGSQSTAPWTAFVPYTPDLPPLALDETEGKVLAFLAVSMFVLPETRGRGIGPRLVAAALDHACHEAVVLRARRVNVALWVEEGNKGAMKCYEKCGFEYLHGGTSLEGFGAMSRNVAMAKVIDMESMEES